tara:strand:- start:3990 stop:4547 length:558 start_codon:yes stop_codon:yes gene_type:complete
MANESRISGFKPVKSLAGGDWTALIRKYNKDAAASALYIGDVVSLDVDGNVTAAVSGGVVLGVVVALGADSGTTFGETGYFNPNDLGKRFLAATDTGVVGVVPASLSLFEAYSELGQVLSLIQGAPLDFLPAAGSTVTGNSAFSLDVPVNADCRVVEVVTSPDNDPTLANARSIIQFVSTANPLD